MLKNSQNSTQDERIRSLEELENAEIHEMKEGEQMKFMVECSRAAAKYQADRTIQAVMEIMACGMECKEKSEATHKWLGLVKLNGIYYPLWYMLIAAMALAGFVLGIVNLINRL